MKRPGVIVLIALLAIMAVAVAVAIIFWPWLSSWLPQSEFLESWINYFVVDLDIGRWGPVATLLLVALIELIWALSLGRKSESVERHLKRVARAHAREIELRDREMALIKDERTALLAELDLREDLIREEQARLWAQFEELEHAATPYIRGAGDANGTGHPILKSKLIGLGQPELPLNLRSDWLRVISQLERIEVITSVSVRANHAAAQLSHHADGLLRLGDACHTLGQFERALAHYDKAIEHGAVSKGALVNRAVVKLDLGRYQAALQDLDRVLKLGESAWAFLYKGLIQEHLGEDRRALDNYSRAIRLEPTLAEAHFRRGFGHLRTQEYDRALHDESNVLELDSEHAMAYAVRGRARAALGDMQRAMSDLDRACSLAPRLSDPFLHRGLVEHRFSMHEKALADVARAIELDSESAAAYMALGEIRAAMGNYEEAIASFDRTLELNPKQPLAHDSRGKARAARGEYELAIEDYDQALQLDPARSMSLANRGAAYQQLGQDEQAIRDLDLALSLDPNLALAYYARALAYGSVGEYDKASRDLDRAGELDPSYIEKGRSLPGAGPAEATTMSSRGKNRK